MRAGAIDIGSNSIRLLVIEAVDGAEPSAIVRAGEACRLGRGLDRTGVIDPDTAGRASEIVADFARRARQLGATHLVVGATAAIREAANGAEVAGQIRERCGFPVRVLSGDEEARLVYQSVVLGLGSMARRNPSVVFDLGGGSTEIVSGMGDRPGRWVSLRMGAVTLTERFLRSNPPTDNEMAELDGFVDQELMHHCALMPERTPILAGVGGTVTVLASLDRGLEAYDPTLLEGWTIDTARLAALIRRVVTASEDERSHWTVMGAGRSDIIVAGVLVVGRIAARFPSRGLVCSTQGLRFGLARLALGELRDSMKGPTGPADLGH